MRDITEKFSDNTNQAVSVRYENARQFLFQIAKEVKSVSAVSGIQAGCGNLMAPVI
jgi:hypothetical protein